MLWKYSFLITFIAVALISHYASRQSPDLQNEGKNDDIAIRNHEGAHTDQHDWPVFIEFAKKISY